MDTEKLFQYLLILSSIVAAIYANWRTRKLVPLERVEKDATASAAYAEAAAKTAIQVSEYLTRISKLEDKLNIFENKQEKLLEVVRVRDRCIDTLNRELQRRDNLIADWAKGIKILVNQLRDAKIEPQWEPLTEWKFTTPDSFEMNTYPEDDADN